MWDARHDRVLWVDIDDQAAWSWEWPDGPEATLLYRAGREVCAILPADDGGVLVVEADRLVHLDVAGGVLGVRDVVLGRGRRFNDATVDPQGRLLVGTLSRAGESVSEELFRLEHDGRLARLRGGLSLSNGIGFSPNAETMYHVDTLRRRVDLLDATVEVPQVIHHWKIEDGYPDGLAVDVEGCVWLALWGAGAVVRLDPDGQEIERVTVPAPHTTSVAFVGPALDELLITTARSDRAGTSPVEGGVFAVTAKTTGVSVQHWHVLAL